MNLLQELQEWYLSQCDEDWEHVYGISIGTLDNPGWSLEVELTDTDLEGIDFQEQAYGIGEGKEYSGDNWLICKVTENKFIGYGGPRKLEEIINIFLHWTKSNA